MANFASYDYFFFLIFVFSVYWAMPGKYRKIFLLAASVFFYGAHSWLQLLVLSLVLGLSFHFSKVIEKVSRKEFWLVILFTLSPLLIFKYNEIYLQGLVAIRDSLKLGLSLDRLKLMLPLGISFYSFQAIAYLIDVRLKRISSEKNFVNYSLFILFFVKIVAGPIERGKNLLPQFQAEKSFELKNINLAMAFLLMGLFKKVGVADSIAGPLSQLFDKTDSVPGGVLFLAGAFSRLQIYFDFSGYTDIAIGGALLFGYRLIDNFNRPFLSSSISQYWERWHISLSSWVRDYVFYPLLLTPARKLGVYGCTVITFLTLGLWHGGTGNFILYGLVQGVLLAFHVYFRKLRGDRFNGLLQNRGYRVVSTVFTFFVLVGLPTLFFRTSSIAETGTLFAKILNPFASGYFDISVIVGFWQESFAFYLFAVVALVHIVVFPLVVKKKYVDWYLGKSMNWQMALLTLQLIVLAVLAAFSQNQPFIYSEF